MKPLLIDVHSHLDHALLKDDLPQAIQRAKEAGVRHIIANGINPETNRACLELSKKYDIVECGMGIYPRDALREEAKQAGLPLATDYDVDEEIAFITRHKPSIKAISEVGLDFVNGDSAEQRQDFQKMIDLSRKLGKPLVVHSRKAEEACIDMLESSSAKKVVMHCFCGKKRLISRIADNNWHLSIPTSVVRAQQFQEMVKDIPLSHLFCETDSPYLGPFKDQRNEPAFVIESYKKIAELKGMELDEVISGIYLNWQRLFG